MSWYRRSLAIDPTSALAACGAGNLFLGLRQPGEAEKYFRLAVKSAPRESIGYVAMASLMSMTGRKTEAEEWLAKARQLDPDSGAAAAVAARDLARSGKRTEALAILERAHAHDSTSFAVEATIGAIRIQDREWAAAEPYLRKAASLRSADPVIWDNLGVALAHMDRRPEAASCFEKSLALDPARTQASLNLGAVLLAEGNPVRALALAEEILRRNPSLPRALELRRKAEAALPRNAAGR